MTLRRSQAGRALLTLALSFIAFASLSGVAHAASPAWKLVAGTGPTNLPPVQSEIQRITVEATGGVFALSQKTGAGEGTPVTRQGHLTYSAGSTTATIVDGAFEVGLRVTGSGIAGGVPGTTVVACSPDCTTAGSTLTLSKETTSAKTNQLVTIITKELTAVSGTFRIGDQLTGTFIEAGTVVTGVGPGSLTISRSPTIGFKTPLTATETTAPLVLSSPSQVLQGALEALPAFGAGSVRVSGGPGGSAATPYFVAFGGPLSNQNVEPLVVDQSGLLGEHIAAPVLTVVPGGAGTGEIAVFPANIGAIATAGAYTLTIGPLPAGIAVSGPAKGEGWSCSGIAGENTVTCTSTGSVPRLTPANTVRFPVEVQAGAPANGVAPVVISGGGAVPASFQIPIVVSTQVAPWGIQALWAGTFDDNGNVSTQAGGHPYSAQTFFLLNTVRGPTGSIIPPGDSKTVTVDLPPGFAGNPMVTQRCPQSQLTEAILGQTPLCNNNMIVGVFDPSLGFFGGAATEFATPIWNDVAPRGSAAEFSTKVAFPVQSLLASVRSSDDYGIRITAPNNPTVKKIYGSYAALEGLPAAAGGKAFLANPTDCAEEARRSPITTFKSATWQPPGLFSLPAVQVLPSVIGCDKLEYHPTFSFQPSSTTGSSPVGATARLHVPQEGLSNPSKLRTPDLKRSVVTLPRGLVLNPSAATGLQACSEAEVGYMGGGFELPNPMRFDESHVSCPDGSKLGTVEVASPVLEESLQGTIYLATPEANPFDSLIALYLVIDDPRTGVIAKLPGRVDPDDGQLTATFDYNPQLPFEDLTLHFRGGGPKSQLATPEVCDTYTTNGSWTPWSAPESGPPAQTSDGFKISSNCASSAGARQFKPGFEAGTTDPVAGGYSPLTIRINRNDGEQEIDRLDFTLPLGVVGKLAGIPYCSDSAIATAAGKKGKDEQANPSCPFASQVGLVDTAAGVGSEPIHVDGKVYLAGPYKGAPISTVTVVPAVAGPFDLGTVVVRAPAFINLETAQITVKSDPVPTMLKGLPLKLRSVAINVNRSGFILNPTNCEKQEFKASLHSSNGNTATPANRFQVGGCNKLKFKPKLKLSLKGATKRSGHPALKAVVTYPKKGAYSNIARAQVGLPHSEFLDQGNLDKVCTQPELKSATCPKRAVYGFAKAWTPLLDKPLEGPVYIGVGYGHKLPDLVADLNGQVRILLHGKVDTTKHEGIRNTFEVVPDAPVSRFVLEMKGGKKYGLLENSENICRKTQRASARFVAQNGLVSQLHPKIANSCKKKKARGRKGHSKKGKGKGGKGKGTKKA